MLNMLKKKLVNKVLVISMIYFFLFVSLSFAFTLAEEQKKKQEEKEFISLIGPKRGRFYEYRSHGRFMDYKELDRLVTVYDKTDVAGEFGKPNIALTEDVYCWCYCYHERDKNIDKVVYLYFSFDDDGMILEVKYLRVYDHGDYEHKKIVMF